MAIYFYPQGFDDQVAIDVDNPGAGFFCVFKSDSASGAQREFTIAGYEIGRTLRDLTNRALCSDADLFGREPIIGLWSMTVSEARQLLPAMQSAIIHAVSGTDRAERTIDEEPDEPDHPLCCNCETNVVWSSANPSPNPWCEQHGHTLFGNPNAYGGRRVWDRATREYEQARERRNAQRQLRLVQQSPNQPNPV